LKTTENTFSQYIEELETSFASNQSHRTPPWQLSWNPWHHNAWQFVLALFLMKLIFESSYDVACNFQSLSSYVTRKVTHRKIINKNDKRVESRGLLSVKIYLQRRDFSRTCKAVIRCATLYSNITGDRISGCNLSSACVKICAEIIWQSAKLADCSPEVVNQVNLILHHSPPFLWYRLFASFLPNPEKSEIFPD